MRLYGLDTELLPILFFPEKRACCHLRKSRALVYIPPSAFCGEVVCFAVVEFFPATVFAYVCVCMPGRVGESVGMCHSWNYPALLDIIGFGHSLPA